MNERLLPLVCTRPRLHLPSAQEPLADTCCHGTTLVSHQPLLSQPWDCAPSRPDRHSWDPPWGVCNPLRRIHQQAQTSQSIWEEPRALYFLFSGGSWQLRSLPAPLLTATAAAAAPGTFPSAAVPASSAREGEREEYDRMGREKAEKCCRLSSACCAGTCLRQSLEGSARWEHREVPGELPLLLLAPSVVLSDVLECEPPCPMRLQRFEDLDGSRGRVAEQEGNVIPQPVPETPSALPSPSPAPTLSPCAGFWASALGVSHVVPTAGDTEGVLCKPRTQGWGSWPSLPGRGCSNGPGRVQSGAHLLRLESLQLGCCCHVLCWQRLLHLSPPLAGLLPPGLGWRVGSPRASSAERLPRRRRSQQPDGNQVPFPRGAPERSRQQDPGAGRLSTACSPSPWRLLLPLGCRCRSLLPRMSGQSPGLQPGVSAAHSPGALPPWVPHRERRCCSLRCPSVTVPGAAVAPPLQTRLPTPPIPPWLAAAALGTASSLAPTLQTAAAPPGGDANAQQAGSVWAPGGASLALPRGAAPRLSRSVGSAWPQRIGGRGVTPGSSAHHRHS